MPFYIPLSFKNIFRDRRRSFTLGVNYFFVSLLLFLVFSVTQGVKVNIADNVITSSAGHVTISGEYIVRGRTYQGIKDFPRVSQTILAALPGAKVLTRYALYSAVYYKNVSKRLSFVGFNTGIDRGLRDQITVDNGSWEAFAGQDNGVLLPQSIARYFGLAIGDELLISTRSRQGAFNTATIQVKGLYKTGNYFLRDLVLCHFGFLQSFDLSDPATASKMFVFFPDPARTAQDRDLLVDRLGRAGFIAVKPASDNDALNAVSAASPRYKVLDSTVNQIRLTLATADEVTGIVSKVVAAVNGVGLFIAAIMLFIISISIFINMRMTINERMLEIGTLRAMGAERGDVVRLFMFENMFLSVLFVCAGIMAGLLVFGLFAGVISVPSEGVWGLFVNRGRLVLRPTLQAAAFILLALVFFTALFSYFPARRGGTIPAVDALNKTT